MTTANKTTHIDRTAHEPRDNVLIPPPSPSIPKLTHTPKLAIQSSPLNPPAAYLWQNPSLLLQTPVRIRIGGSFTYPPQITPPPPSTSSTTTSTSTPPPVPLDFKNLLLIAGGVGINPLISILSHIATLPPHHRPHQTTLFYTLKDPNNQIQSGDTSQALFLDRIIRLFSQTDGLNGSIKLFLTGGGPHTDKTSTSEIPTQGITLPFEKRRISLSDVAKAIGEDKDNIAVYICGVPSMTDQLVAGLTSPSPQGLGIEKNRVLYEKWW
ncbi:hypothetical protein QBC41DRAFT_368588 [Cercophora samala]|uniref:Ferric reductase NAD binding domain-containing protein n=1 Tax=Cercophora samala TaxID=330535 RepID=A0AA39YZ28_9PEZI|nr:hypothetical protein QBC41DRAFT_368588 [Cercophora samala]